jgi:GTP-binding protein
LVLDVPTEGVGSVMERLGSRRAELKDMRPAGDGRSRLEFSIPTRCLLGFRTEYLSLTRGEGLMHHVFSGYAKSRGEAPGRSRGVLFATDAGESAAFGIYQTQDRGTMFIDPRMKVYAGMIVGENSREGDLGINVVKTKPMSNMRSSGADEALTLVPPRKMSLEACLEFIEDDELVEVTPQTVRLRKKVLDATKRKRQERAALEV